MVATVEKLTADWIAVIYNSSREKTSSTFLLDGEHIQRAPVGRYLQIPMTIPKTHVIGQALELRSIFFRPGTNLSTDLGRILKEDWQAILRGDEEKGKRGEIQSMRIALSKGVFEVFEPDLWDGVGNPGFRHFSPEFATKLVLATAHELWLEEWMSGETRAQIIKVAGEQKEKILQARKRYAA